MTLENLFHDQPLYELHGCTKSTLATPVREAVSFPLTHEHILTLYVNGEQVNTFTCSPAQLAELCIGWLLSEGYLRTPEDLESLRISRDGHRAEATIACPSVAEPAPFPAFAPVDPARVEIAARLLYHDETVHARTHGTHGCVLADNTGRSLLAEDIGRYNAADKAIGAAVLQDIDPRTCLLLSSGRVPEGMVLKTVRAGIPVLVSKAVTTVQALNAAKQYRLTLCFFTRENHFLSAESPTGKEDPT